MLAIDGEELTADRRPVPPAAEQGRPAGDADAQRDARRRTARARSRSSRSPSEANLVYLDWVHDEPRGASTSCPTGASATCTCPTWAPTASASSSSGTTAQIRKEGLVVDVRANGGGNVSRMLIERLRRAGARRSTSRARDEPAEHLSGRRVPRADGRHAQRELVVGRRHLPGDVPRGEARAADRQALVGRRRRHHDRGPLIDGGTSTCRSSASPRAKGEWIIEGYGVDPDIDVENDPKSVIAGPGSAARARRRRGDEGPRDPRAAAGPPRRAGSHPEGHAADAARGVAYFTSRARADAVTRRASRIAGRTPKARPAAARESAAASEQRGR